MARNDQKPEDLSPVEPDDFKYIHGIKQGIENRLHVAGIQTYAQLAVLSPDEILAALGKMIGYTARRIADEDWAGQAKELAQTMRKPEAAEQPEERMLRQHYATFTLELLLGEENEVRRTRVVHIQREAEETWAGWDETRLVRFIKNAAKVPETALKAAPLKTMDLGAKTQESAPHISAGVEPAAVEPAAVVPAASALTGSPQIRELDILLPVTGAHHRTVPEGQPFEMDLALDLSDIHLPPEEPLSFQVEAQAKALGRGTRLPLSRAEGTLHSANVTGIKLHSGGLPCGAYRIAFDLKMTLPASGQEQPELDAVLDGGVLRVY